MVAFYRRWWSDKAAAGRRRGVWRACNGGWSAGVGSRRRVAGKRDGDGMACAALRRASYTLVLQFMIVPIAPSIKFKFVILCNCALVRISALPLTLRAFFILVPGLWFMQFSPQFTIKLSIVFNLIPNYAKLALKNLIGSLKILIFSIKPKLNSIIYFFIN